MTIFDHLFICLTQYKNFNIFSLKSCKAWYICSQSSINREFKFLATQCLRKTLNYHRLKVNFYIRFISNKTDIYCCTIFLFNIYNSNSISTIILYNFHVRSILYLIDDLNFWSISLICYTRSFWHSTLRLSNTIKEQYKDNF